MHAVSFTCWLPLPTPFPSPAVLKPSSPPIELAGVEPSLPPAKTKEEIAAERCCCQCKCAIL